MTFSVLLRNIRMNLILLIVLSDTQNYKSGIKLEPALIKGFKPS